MITLYMKISSYFSYATKMKLISLKEVLIGLPVHRQYS